MNTPVLPQPAGDAARHLASDALERGLAATGVPGDAWLRKVPQKLDAQLSVMCIGVAELIANGQPLTLFGDNRFVDLDLSVENRQPAARRLGAARSDGRTAQRLRGLYTKVFHDGEIACGDAIEVTSRG